LSCINIWSDFDLFRVRNFFFTRMGVFAYHKDDDKRVDTQIAVRTGQKVIEVVDGKKQVKPQQTAVD